MCPTHEGLEDLKVKLGVVSISVESDGITPHCESKEEQRNTRNTGDPGQNLEDDHLFEKVKMRHRFT